MNTKLTLSLDANVIEKAKIYAKSRQISLSFLVENYLKLVSFNEKKEGKLAVSPLVKSLSGVAKNLPENFDYKEELTKILMEKHGL